MYKSLYNCPAASGSGNLLLVEKHVASDIGILRTGVQGEFLENHVGQETATLLPGPKTNISRDESTKMSKKSAVKVIYLSNMMLINQMGSSSDS